MDESFKNQFDSAKSILILLPIDPRLDEVAAGLSLALSLKGKKETSISCPSQMTVEFSRLVGVNKVTNELGNKNLVIKFPNYPANDIERVSYDIENEQFTLTVIPKAGFLAPKSEQIQTNYTGALADTIILIGGEKEEHFPALLNPDLKGIKVMHLGFRILETKNAQVMSFAKPSSSVSEIIAKLIKDNQWQLDTDIATNLLTGIEQGSVGFQRKEVSAETFQLMSELLNLGGQRLPRIDPKQFPQGSVPQAPYTQPVQQVAKPTPTSVPAPTNSDQSQPVPQAWTEPKVYTGTSVS